MDNKKVNNIKPIIFDADKIEISDIKKKYKISKIIDAYKLQLEDLFLVRNPKYKFNKNYKEDFERFVKKYSKGKPLEKCGNWVYFPWDQVLVHFLEDKLHQEIRTARNKNFITKEEQEKFYRTKVGIAGLSVGSNIAMIIALMGGGKFMKFADPDIVAPSNLNRINLDFTYLGINKAEAVAQKIFRIDPYAKLELYTDGINKKNIKEFLGGIDILVEELDDLEVKIKIREEARKKRIPVLMATDNGDSVIVDIERYDLNPKYPILHGRLKNFDVYKIKTSLEAFFEGMHRFIDFSLVHSRALSSALEVGKTIYSWPQLATAANFSGVVVAYLVKEISLGKKIKSGKYLIDLEKFFNPNYQKELKERKKILEKYLKIFKL